MYSLPPQRQAGDSLREGYQPIPRSYDWRCHKRNPRFFGTSCPGAPRRRISWAYSPGEIVPSFLALASSRRVACLGLNPGLAADPVEDLPSTRLRAVWGTSRVVSWYLPVGLSSLMVYCLGSGDRGTVYARLTVAGCSFPRLSVYTTLSPDL